MAAKHSRHIALTAPLATYLDEAVARGNYASASDVVRAALRLLIAQDAVQHTPSGEIRKSVKTPPSR